MVTQVDLTRDMGRLAARGKFPGASGNFDVAAMRRHSARATTIEQIYKICSG